MRIFIFSHIADVDGVTPIILSKLAFENIDYKLIDNPIDEIFLDYINNNDFSIYDYIFMTDLCISEDTINKLSDDFKKKFLIFDHHISNIKMNKYQFIKVVVEQNNKDESATSIYYDYLVKNFKNELLIKESTKQLVDFVRICDTYTFDKENKEEAIYIADFLSMVGINEYVEYFYNFIFNNNKFYFEEKLKYLFEVEEKRKKLYIEEKSKQVISCYIKPFNVGIVFAENYRSSLGNKLAKMYDDKYDFIVIINMSRSVSLRGIKDIDLNAFANIYGGKGHKKAAGFSLPEGLKEKVIKEIFKNIEIRNDENER